MGSQLQVKGFILLTMYLLFVPLSFSQNNAKDTVKLGGFARYDEFSKTIVEAADIKVLYQYTYPVIEEGKMLQQTDTMLLIAGKNHSTFYDWSRDVKFSQLSKKFVESCKNIEGFRMVTFDKFLEMNQDAQNYSELTMKRNNAEITKNRTQGVIVTRDYDDTTIFDEPIYQLSETIPSPQWEMYDDVQMVLGYECRKATCTFAGREYIAWFTLDIPIQDGPYKFYGLPGLILKIEDTQQLYRFTAVGIEKLQNTVIISDVIPNVINCTPEQYVNIKKRMYETLTQCYLKNQIIHYYKGRTSYQVPNIEIR